MANTPHKPQAPAEDTGATESAQSSAEATSNNARAKSESPESTKPTFGSVPLEQPELVKAGMAAMGAMHQVSGSPGKSDANSVAKSKAFSRLKSFFEIADTTLWEKGDLMIEILRKKFVKDEDELDNEVERWGYEKSRLGEVRLVAMMFPHGIRSLKPEHSFNMHTESYRVISRAKKKYKKRLDPATVLAKVIEDGAKTRPAIVTTISDNFDLPKPKKAKANAKAAAKGKSFPSGTDELPVFRFSAENEIDNTREYPMLIVGKDEEHARKIAGAEITRKKGSPFLNGPALELVGHLKLKPGLYALANLERHPTPTTWDVDRKIAEIQEQDRKENEAEGGPPTPLS